MKHLRHTVFLALLACGLGCRPTTQDQPIWKDIKLSDLAPAQAGDGTFGRPLNNISFTVLVLEIPADKAPMLDALWPVLYSEPLRFRNYDAFAANDFKLGFGQAQSWPKVAEVLSTVDARKVQTVSLLLSRTQPNDYPIARLIGRQLVVYTSTELTEKSVWLGPGRIALRIKAAPVPGLRGLCDFHAEPVFIPPPAGPVPELQEKARANEVAFPSAGFALKIAPAEFFVLAPASQPTEKPTLANYFFARPAPAVRPFLVRPDPDAQTRRLYYGPVVRIYLFFCTRINY